MFKSVFTKYVTAFMIMIGISFSLLAIILSQMVSGYAQDSKSRVIERTSETLTDFITSQYREAGGDFNQSFPDGTDRYPIASGADWTPGTLGDLPAGWRYAWDSAAPTCRLLNQPYSAGSSGTQFYVIDGFILSPNVEPVSVRTQDAEFAVTDHNPVVLEARLVS